MSVYTEELTKLKPHRWQVSCLDFNYHGSRLATAGWDKEVHIWELDDLKVITTLEGVHQVAITSLCWQRPHGQLLCTGSADHTAALWNADTGTYLKTLSGHEGWVLGTCFSVHGSALATASWDKTFKIWDLERGTDINTYTDHTEGVWSVDFNPTSSAVLCTGSEDGTVKIWDLREGKVAHDLTAGHSDAVYCAKWSPDGTLIASGSADTKVIVMERGIFV